jgi:hypothetical protein
VATKGKGKAAVPGRGGRKAPTKAITPITADQYNKLWAGFTIKQTPAFAARHAGIPEKLAVAYIEGAARPDLGMVPIRERWQRVMNAAQEEANLTVAEWHRRNLQAIQVAMGTVTTEIALLAEDAKMRLATYQQSGGATAPELRESLHKVAETADRLIRLGERMLGGPDQKIQVNSGSGLDTLTVEELVEFATTGLLPPGHQGKR